MTDEKPMSLKEQVLALLPRELLSEGGAAELFSTLEADRDLDWDRANLEAELREHPRRALKWALVASAAEQRVADQLVHVRHLRAQLDARTRQLFSDTGVRGTEAMVAATLDADPELRGALGALNAAEALARVCGELRELFRQRKDLLVVQAQASAELARADASERRAMTLTEAARLRSVLADGASRPTRTPLR